MASSTTLNQSNFRQSTYSVDFSQNREKPFFVAAFADKKIRIWDLN